MPFHKKIYVFGNLFIHFKIKFPDSLNTDQMSQVSEALQTQKKKNAEKSGGDEEVTIEMRTFDEAHRNLHHGGGTRGNDSDDEDDDEGESGGPRVGCQTQ